MPNEEKFIVLIVVEYTDKFVCVKVEKHSGTNKKMGIGLQQTWQIW